MRQISYLFVYLALVCTWVGSELDGDTIYVSTCGNDAWSGAEPNCVGPDGSKATIQTAINAAMGGDTVIVLPGTYTGVGNRDIDFGGKAITVQSIDPNNPDIVSTTIIDPNQTGICFGFFHGEGSESILDGLTITRGWGTGIYCYQSSPTIRNCLIKNCFGGNGGAGIACGQSYAIISKCIINGNVNMASGGGIACFGGEVTIRNCVISGNLSDLGGGIAGFNCNINIHKCTLSCNPTYDNKGEIYLWESNAPISSCILWSKDVSSGPEIVIEDYDGTNPSTVAVSYCDILGGRAGVYLDSTSTLNWMEGNVDINPIFVREPNDCGNGWGDNPLTPEDESANNDYGDLHLRSQAGRWDPNSKSWVYDSNTSPCIDAGDPASDWSDELCPNGGRINIGAYGGTAQASHSMPDLNWDKIINLADYGKVAYRWLKVQEGLIEDLNCDGVVDILDLNILVDNWLWGNL